jgi:hypothetical protein
VDALTERVVLAWRCMSDEMNSHFLRKGGAVSSHLPSSS